MIKPDIDFNKVKKPEFITAVRIPENIHYEEVDDVFKSVIKPWAVRVAEYIDDIIFKEIYEIAKEKGVTDVFIISKKSVAEALEKQIPKKPTNFSGRHWNKATGGNCPNCKCKVNSEEYRYCRKCGQALDWGQEDDKL